MSVLHNSDLMEWAEEQSSLLKNREFEKLDIENIIQELDAVGKSEQHALYSYLVVYFTHMLKIKYQSGLICNSWLASCSNSKKGIKFILKRFPSYKKFLNEFYDEAYESAREKAHYETGIILSCFPEKIDQEFIDELEI